MFEQQTPEAIRSRIIGRLITDLQTREGSFAGDCIASIAVELSEIYHSLDALTPMFYIDETSGPYIDRQAATVGIVRKAGTLAACAITFTGTDGAAVPAGAPFYTASGLTWYLAEAVTIAAGTATGSLTAAEAGARYNIGVGEIVSTLRNYSGVAAYSNAAATGGTDAETDQALVNRYYARMRQSPTSGNPYHYQMWAIAMDGVGASRVISKWDGAGTVKVLLAGPQMEPVSETVASATAAYIETQRPAGPVVTVSSATGHELAVSATVTVDGTTSKSEVQGKLQSAVSAYLRELVKAAFADNVDLQVETLAEKTYTVLYNRIAFLLLSIPGVVDYTVLTVGGGTANIVMQAGEVPVLTGVTVA